jgi:hypothetical protein
VSLPWILQGSGEQAQREQQLERFFSGSREIGTANSRLQKAKFISE